MHRLRALVEHQLQTLLVQATFLLSGFWSMYAVRPLLPDDFTGRLTYLSMCGVGAVLPEPCVVSRPAFNAVRLLQRIKTLLAIFREHKRFRIR